MKIHLNPQLWVLLFLAIYSSPDCPNSSFTNENGSILKVGSEASQLAFSNDQIEWAMPSLGDARLIGQHQSLVFLYGLLAGLLILPFFVGIQSLLRFVKNREAVFLYYGVYLIVLSISISWMFDAGSDVLQFWPLSFQHSAFALPVLAGCFVLLTAFIQHHFIFPNGSSWFRPLRWVVLACVLLQQALASWYPEMAGWMFRFLQVAVAVGGMLFLYYLIRKGESPASYKMIGLMIVVFSYLVLAIDSLWGGQDSFDWVNLLLAAGFPLQVLFFSLSLYGSGRRAAQAENPKTGEAREKESTVAVAPGLLPAEEATLGLSISPQDEALLSQLQRHIAAHLDDRSFDVKSMAALASKSPAAFHPWFKSVTGTTPAKYLAVLRIERADYLLATTDDTMEAIALKTGFNDGAYLANKYKRHYGICPSEARKRHLKRKSQEN